MKDWLRRFFAVDNAINENTVVGSILLICLIVSIFTDVSADKFYTLAGSMVICYGFGTLKK